ncbi:AAA family ATPase [Paramaledivibacter caminithermalis]|uniref:Nuclease SbcCD subunit C n=1 Tax=Paramaledivibacter caminithermalis (strain DSM 15212 / CIP 107654 / DViRD3) TaxID=1121301 RepID=A0A1M6PRA5_PARC5|nr:SbcC/MukB-like Walker B domain-containing protein [Paramaledivibacter caminithermalis]SHK10432.1 exonuclease SbcC [Paramaledivibacter caminithermalis DSM 15212]
MKPKLLKISGLNSFVDEQIIDFSTLVDSGLFGIFGPTGSGKSTILDAITIALYGYNAIARDTKEFINTDLEKVYIGYEFDCSGSNGRQTYRIERSIKKNKNGGIKTAFARLSFLDDGGNVLKIIDKVSQIDEEVKKIIGLNHQDFTRSVVLPQGKFSEFLKLSGSDRRNMLERILGLEQYGGNLTDKIKKFKKKKEEELQLLKGELNRFDGVSEENLKVLKEELCEIRKKEKELKIDINLIEKRYQELSDIWRLQSELSGYLKSMEDLEKETKEIENMRNRCERARNSKNVKPYLDRYNDTLEDINKNKAILKDILIKLDDINEKLKGKESEYKEICRRKDRELPILIEKEANVKYAIELKEEAQSLIDERRELTEKYIKYSEIIEKSEKELNNLKMGIKKDSYEIEELENKSSKLKISPEYREKLTNAWEFKKEYDELKREKKVSLKSIEDLKNNILASDNQLSKIKEELEIRNTEYVEIKDKLQRLELNPPKNNDYIMNKEIELHRLRSTLEDAKENIEKKSEIEEELRLIYENKKDTQIKMDYLKNRLTHNIDKLEDVKKEIDELEKSHRAAILSQDLKEGKPCPVCGSSHHPNVAEPIDYEAIEKIRKIKQGFEENKKELEKAIYKLEIEIKRDEKEENKYKRELDKYINKLKNINIAKLEKEIIDLIKEIDDRKISLKNWENKRDKLIKALEFKDKEKINFEKQSIRFVECIKKDRTRLEQENTRKEELDKKLKEASKAYIEAKTDLNIENIKVEIENIKRNDKELEVIEAKLTQLKNNVKKFDSQREKVEKKLNQIMLERSKVEEAGREKGKIIDEYNNKIKKIVKNREPKVYLKELKEKKSIIINEEETLRKIIEEEKKILDDLKQKRAGLENTNKSLGESIINIEQDLKEALKENRFNSIDEVKVYLLPNEELKAMEDKIAKYDNESNKLKDNINRVKKKLKGSSLEEKEFLKFKEDMENKKEAYKFLIEEIGKKKEKINEMEKNFHKIKKINKKVENLSHITDMLSEMFKLVSGNKFVEYVATSHLRYIVKEASKRLMDITNNRYNLELDSNSNFIICDNFSGGVKRDCNTLSGGETFLTSLALALSLSSQIQLKGNSTIEFFFLDEGFGTLDNHLLDIVMTSLEKLNQENLAVGIISHVEELKNRVPIKLVVTPPESGLYGTKVAIEKN